MSELREGYPEEGELIIATVTRIQYHSIFCRLDEFKDKSGMLHISEIAPGRIKNVRDYVTEGKTLVLKVLGIDTNKGHIDLSLRRVTEQQKKQKAAQRKHEQIVENIIEQVSAASKIKSDALLKHLTQQTKEYQSIFLALQAVIDGETSMDELDIKKDYQEPLQKVITERIKPKQVMIKAEAEINTFKPDGVNLIQESFAKLKDVSAYYKGGSTYALEITAPDYKQAEDTLTQAKGTLREYFSEDECTFARADGR